MGHGCPAPGPDRALQSRLPLDPAPSLHRLRGGRRRLVRRLPRYYGRVRLLHPVHRRLRPPAFPTRPRLRLAGAVVEISRLPDGRRPRITGSTTTRGRRASRDHDARRVAFCWTQSIGTPDLAYAARWLAYALPCQRFTPGLAAGRA